VCQQTGPAHAIAAEAPAAEKVKAAAPAAVAKRDFLNKVIFPTPVCYLPRSIQLGSAAKVQTGAASYPKSAFKTSMETKIVAKHKPNVFVVARSPMTT
jgi:hypothetical protein